MRQESNTRAPTRLPAFVLSLILFAVALFPQRAAAESALVDLAINGNRSGTVEIELDPDPDGQVYIPSALLASSLDGIAKPELVSRIAEAHRFFGVEELSPLGLGVAFDRNALALALRIDTASMAQTTIGLSRKAQQGRGEASIENSILSSIIGFNLDYEPSYSWNAGGAASFANSLRLSLSPAIRLFGLVAEGQASLSYGPYGFDGSLNAAQGIVDFPSAGARLRLGMVDTNPVSFQSSQRLYGLGFARDGSLPGAAKASSSLDGQFFIERDAELSVLVNGIEIKRVRVAPGNYRFSDLPLASGLNEVSVVIREQGLPPRTVKLGIPFSDALLRPGQLDYSASFGSLSAEAFEPFGSARLALGLSRDFQFGINAEAGAESALGGLALAAATAAGTFGLEGALSSARVQDMALSFASWSTRFYWRFALPSAAYIPQLGFAAEYRSPLMAAGNAVLPARSLELSGQIGENLPGRLGAISLSGQARLLDSELERWSASLGLSFTLSKSAFLSVSGGGDWNSASGSAPRLSALLTVTQPDKGLLSYTQSLGAAADSESLSLGLDKEGRGNLSFAGSGLLGSGQDRSAELALSGRSDIAALSGRGSFGSRADGSSSELAGRLSLSSTLVFADGAFAATSSPGGALAILQPSPKLRGQKVEVRSLSGALSSSPAGGARVIAGLVPYSGYVAGIELPESDPDSRPFPSSFSLKPEYRSVAVARVGFAPSIAIRGILVDQGLKPVANMPGYLLDDRGAILPFAGTFSDEGGNFECYGLSPGLAAIRWDDGSSITVNIPYADPGSMIDLGKVIALPESSGGGK